MDILRRLVSPVSCALSLSLSIFLSPSVSVPKPALLSLSPSVCVSEYPCVCVWQFMYICLPYPSSDRHQGWEKNYQDLQTWYESLQRIVVLIYASKMIIWKLCSFLGGVSSSGTRFQVSDDHPPQGCHRENKSLSQFCSQIRLKDSLSSNNNITFLLII